MAKVFGASAVVFLLFFSINCNFNICATSEHIEIVPLDPYASLTKHAAQIGLHKIQKRQSQTDIKNQYQSVSQNSTEALSVQPNSSQTQDSSKLTAAVAAINAGSNSSAAVETSVLVPYNSSNRPLVGVNGTGQRIDVTDSNQSKATVLSEPIQSAQNVGNSKYPKKVYSGPASGVGGVVEVQQPPEAKDELMIDNVDVPENETITELQKKNYTVNQTTDYHDYYNSTIYVNKQETDAIWNEIENITHNTMLSQSHRRAMTVELTFDFPFYGHPVRNITVATGGFLYTGEYVHSWLAATQYIAPLMANFDTSLGNDSYVRFNDNGTAFTVIWENVSLQDKQDVGKFSFSTTLHQNGDISFVYFQVPIDINAIQDDKHPVKVGLSDAYIIDKVVYFARRKTIYEYHRVNFASTDITNSTIIYLKALPTCLQYTDCGACINHATSFDCNWCPNLNRCSTGTDRRKQEWLQRGCDKTQISTFSECPLFGQKGNNANQTKTPESVPPTTNNKNNDKINPPNEHASSTISTTNVESLDNANKAAAIDNNPPQKNVGLAFGVLAPICLVITVLLWLLYAYRNPHTKSGQLLIQFRPSQWSWRRGEARYTAATIHM